MIWRALRVGALALLLAASTTGAAVPEGPRLAVFKLSPKPPRLELLTVDPNGKTRPVRLAGGGWRSRPHVDFFSPLSWSSDGEAIAFSATVAYRNGDGAEPIKKIFIARADGSGLGAIRGTRGGTGPVLSPDGRTVAFARSIDRPSPTTVDGKFWDEGFSGSTIWTVDLATGVPRRLTPWRDGLRYDASSFSPDGSTLLASREDSLLASEPQPVALKLDGSGSTPLFNDGSSPVYSPDGSKIALIRRTVEYGDTQGEDSDLYVMDADGDNVRRLTRTPGRLELFPSWDPSGERLAYVRLPVARSEDAPFGFRDALMHINADGTCQTKVASAPFTFYFAPAWQPGPGREAGRIEC